MGRLGSGEDGINKEALIFRIGVLLTASFRGFYKGSIIWFYDIGALLINLA